ncbi:hypothetical protein N7526_001242 [Penicillium atrosanguineum]|nr:hypothetical protein N7526_001242 [Penicillium atrosanguineum]
MSSYFSSFTGSSSSLSSALGSRLTSLRRAITLGDEGDDPENEDGSHISNALRAYYTEKGRPFPSCFPKVKAPPPYPTAGAEVSGDLWGDSGASQPAGAQTASLRRGRVGNAPPLLPMNSAPPGPVSTPSPPLQHAHSHSPGPPGGQPGPRACRKTGRGRHKSDCGHGFRGAGLRALMSIRV